VVDEDGSSGTLLRIGVEYGFAVGGGVEVAPSFDIVWKF